MNVETEHKGALPALGGANQEQVAMVMESIATLARVAGGMCEDLAFGPAEKMSQRSMHERAVGLQAMLGQIGWLAVKHGGGDRQGDAAEWLLPLGYSWVDEDGDEGGVE